jgi:S-adenosylmethionine uptake transporter
MNGGSQRIPNPMIKGVLFGFLTYVLFSCADACTKAMGATLPVFEIAFFITLASVSTFGFARSKSERWREVFRFNRFRLVFLRAICGTIAGIFGIYAFTTIPFAEAYSVLFLMPLFATVLSIPVLGEKVGWRRWLAVAIGFVGVLLVVRPGFHQLHLGHLSALASAACASVAIITLRRIGPTEKRISVLAVLYLTALTVNGILMIHQFRVPTTLDIGLIILAGVVGGFGQISMLTATRLAPANRVTPTQYSQIIWAIILGALFFNEYPDGLAFAGMALVVCSGLFTFFREEQLRGWSRRTLLMRNRP